MYFLLMGPEDLLLFRLANVRIAHQSGSLRSKTKEGWQGLFCPCVLFGRNLENLREVIPWTRPCICHAIFVEGGTARSTATAILHHRGIDPSTSFLIGAGLLLTWWVCGIYRGLFQQKLRRKYHLRGPFVLKRALILVEFFCANVKILLDSIMKDGNDIATKE
ncbi:cell number regulator 6-like [Nymphaea colorata]|uniref:cell number regulator 6-like n=1 Tax=Nymphaea colorata TaxID=210225 RepID=UPI00129D52F2|nr:cell number regulator 6-like [Nymphaea colorata]XP_031503223.1 cell number regulator 6-like [Nymphaea colorata]